MKNFRSFAAISVALGSLLIFSGCPDPGPLCVEVLHLSFNQSVVDSAKPPHQVVTNGKLKYVPNRFDQQGHALRLDGNASLSIPDRTDIHFTNSSSFTISAWVLTRDRDTTGIVCKGPSNGNVPGYRLELMNGRPHAAITATRANVQITGVKSIADNVWHLVTLTVTPTKVTLYVDTLSVGTHTGAHLVPDSLNNAPLLIGTTPNGAHNFNGYLDGVSINPCAKSPTEVVNTFNQWRSTTVLTLADLPPGMSNDSPTRGVLGMSWATQSVGYCCGMNGLLLKTTDGLNWSNTASTIQGINLFGICFKDPLKGVVLGQPNHVYVTMDGGTTWIPSDPGFPSNWSQIQLSDIKIVDGLIILSGSYGWNYGGNAFMYTGTFGANSISWSVPRENTGQGEITSIGYGGYNGNTFVWALGINGQIWKYNKVGNGIDAGSAEPPAADGGPDFHVCDFLSYTGGILGFAGTRAGEIYRYSSAPGSGWTFDYSPTSNQWIVGVHASQAQAFAVTDGDVPATLVTDANGHWTQASSNAGPWLGLSYNGASVLGLPYPLLAFQLPNLPVLQ